MRVESIGKAKVLSGIIVGLNKGKYLTPALKKYRRNLEKTATRHYRNLGTIVKFQLGSGIGDPKSSGSRIIKTSDGEGVPISYATGYWPALTKEHIARSPVSRRIWKKRGKGLHSEIQKDLPRNKLKARISHKRVQKLKSRKNVIRAIHDIAFNDPGNKVLADLIAQPFVYGKGSIADGFSAHGLAEGTSEMMGYPEATKRTFTREGPLKGKRINRPWVAGLSGRLGLGMHKAISKLKLNA